MGFLPTSFGHVPRWSAAFALMAVGTVLGVRAAGMDHRLRVRLAAAATVLLTALWVTGFLWAAALPAPAEAAAAEVAPDFTLPDQDGRAVNLRARLAAGPVLLVFFRGFW